MRVDGNVGWAEDIALMIERAYLECEGVNVVVHLHDVRNTSEHSACHHRGKERERGKKNSVRVRNGVREMSIRRNVFIISMQKKEKMLPLCTDKELCIN